MTKKTQQNKQTIQKFGHRIINTSVNNGYVLLPLFTEDVFIIRLISHSTWEHFIICTITKKITVANYIPVSDENVSFNIHLFVLFAGSFSNKCWRWGQYISITTIFCTAEMTLELWRIQYSTIFRTVVLVSRFVYPFSVTSIFIHTSERVKKSLKIPMG
jgi:hypothetical protein